jgi:diguanylate cyclase (GGDEF)-like protein
MLVIDVDHFKTINDRFGHDRGDEALKLIAGVIAANVRDTDLVGRLGGEEFCVFLPEQSREAVSMVAERIRVAISDAVFAVGGEHHPLSVSVGGAIFDGGSAHFKALYQGADERLYHAKRTGRNRVELSTLQPTDAGSPGAGRIEAA